MKKIILSALCLILLGCSSPDDEVKSLLHHTPVKKEKAEVLSNFFLPGLDGKQYSLKDWQDKVIILNFWATWCPPCRREMPGFVELDDEYAANGLQMVAIAIDEKSAVEDFVDSLGIEFPILVGGTDAVRLARQYGNKLGGLPYSVIIDRQGFIRHQVAGELTKQEAIDYIRPLL